MVCFFFQTKTSRLHKYLYIFVANSQHFYDKTRGKNRQTGLCNSPKNHGFKALLMTNEAL